VAAGDGFQEGERLLAEAKICGCRFAHKH
jgi:hypothetical protein